MPIAELNRGLRCGNWVSCRRICRQMLGLVYDFGYVIGASMFLGRAGASGQGMERVTDRVVRGPPPVIRYPVAVSPTCRRISDRRISTETTEGRVCRA
jgi:hypothetical protein